MCCGRFAPRRADFEGIRRENGPQRRSVTPQTVHADRKLQFGGQLWAQWQLWTSGGPRTHLLIVCPRMCRLTAQMSSKEVIYVVTYGRDRDGARSVTIKCAAPGGFSDVIYAQNARERCLKAPRTRGPPSEQLFDVIYGRNVIYGVRERRKQLY
jgi:hypothetical protein